MSVSRSLVLVKKAKQTRTKEKKKLGNDRIIRQRTRKRKRETPE